MIGLGVTRYIYTHNMKQGYIKAYNKDKVILHIRGGKVVTGVIMYIGTKNITLVINKVLEGKRCTQYSTFSCKLHDVKNFAKYPENSQRYGAIKL